MAFFGHYKAVPSSDPGLTVAGDLDSPHVKEYPGCEPGAWECRGVQDD